MIILTTCLFVASTESPSLIFLPLLSILALLSKEQGIVLPLFWALRDLQRHHLGQRQKYFWSISSTISTIAFLALLRMWLIGFSYPTFQAGDNPGAALPHSLNRVATLQHYWALHALLLIWPQWLCFDWALSCVPVLDISKPDLRLLSPLLLGCTFVFVALKAFKDACEAR